jgi:dTDP-glucose 4,6-dehydratase
MLDTIIRGTQRSLAFAAASGAKRFLFVSSGAVYGKQPADMTHIPETYAGAPDPMDPNSAYGEGKRVGELLCSIAHKEHGLEITIARCFAFVGPHLPLDAHFAIGNFIRDALKGQPILVKNGSPYRSYLYAADLSVWLWTILFKGAACHPYNVGSDQEISIAQLAETVASVSGGATSPSISQPLNSSSFVPSRYVPLVERSQSELGLQTLIPLNQSIQRTTVWHRHHQ